MSSSTSWWYRMRLRVSTWQIATFGNVELYKQARKLQHEAEELECACTDDQRLAELADCRIVLMALEALSGFTEDQLRAAVELKHAKNLRRKWRQLEDSTWQHVKEDK